MWMISGARSSSWRVTGTVVCDSLRDPVCWALLLVTPLSSLPARDHPPSIVGQPSKLLQIVVAVVPGK